jgi:hypothetical protein
VIDITGRTLARSADAGVRPRFARKQFFPAGWESCLAQFLELFHRYGYIYRPLDGGTWSSANERWKLSDGSIIKAIACAQEKFLIGTRSGKTTRYAVLDIDAGSKYHNKEELERLLLVLSEAGLSRSSLYRSSFSEGWHLYIFFDKPINSARVHQQLVKLLKMSGLEVTKGTLEVFPHPGYASLGMGLRLPLQTGWAWLDKKTLEVEHERFEMSATKALEFFLDVLESDANSLEDFHKLGAYVRELEIGKGPHRVNSITDRPSNVVPLRKPDSAVASSENDLFVASVFGHMPLNISAETWNKGRLFHLKGLTAPSQRAEALFCLGHYFFYGDPSRDLPSLGYGCADERRWAVEQFLNAHHNGFSKDLSRGRADATAQIERAANWLPVHKRAGEVQKYVLNQPIAWKKENENRQAGARQRIKDALAALLIRKRPFSTVELKKAARCGGDTLYKHADIWRQDYEDLADGFFAACPDEYNAVSFPDAAPSFFDSVVSESIPIGLLAARQIASEFRLSNQQKSQGKQRSVFQSSLDPENTWRRKVSCLTREVPSDLSSSELKARLFVLTNCLSVAPYEEDVTALLPYVQGLRREIQNRYTGPNSFKKSKSNSVSDTS